MSTLQTLVSIIIPTYNRADLIGETLDSVIAQTYQNWECIVVDDGSSDNTEQVVQSYINKDKRFRYYHRPPEHQPGGNGARNYGFKKSKGEYIQWFDSDDLMLPQKLEVQINDLTKNNKKIHTCSGKQYFVEDDEYKSLKMDFSKNVFCQVASNSSQIMTPSLLIEREVFIKTGVKFNEQLTRAQETYFLAHLFILVNNDLIYQSDQELFIYIMHNQTITKSDEVYNSNNINSKSIVFSKIWELNKKIDCKGIKKKMYKKNIRLLFSALRNDDIKVAQMILKNLKFNLKERNQKIYFYINISYYVLKILPKLNYKLRTMLLQQKRNLK